MKNKNDDRKSEAAPLKSLMNDLFKSYHIKQKFDQTKLVTSWEQIMGKTIAGHTKKLFVKDRTLFVKLSSAPLKQELTYNKAKVIGLVNAEFEDAVIDNVIFQ